MVIESSCQAQFCLLNKNKYLGEEKDDGNFCSHSPEAGSVGSELQEVVLPLQLGGWGVPLLSGPSPVEFSARSLVPCCVAASRATCRLSCPYRALDRDPPFPSHTSPFHLPLAISRFRLCSRCPGGAEFSPHAGCLGGSSWLPGSSACLAPVPLPLWAPGPVPRMLGRVLTSHSDGDLREAVTGVQPSAPIAC